MSETEKTEREESIGERLHKARLKKRVTIDEVFKETKIHPKILSALEEDRYDEFLSPTYIKAFLKSYCRYLELDAHRILGDYDSLRQKDSQKVILEVKGDAQQILSPKVDWQRYINVAKKWTMPVIIGLLGVIVGIFIITWAFKTAAKLKDVKLFKPRVNIAETKTEPSIIKPLSIPKDQPLTLIVRTKGDVWLQVRADGKTVFQNVLKKGSVESYKATDKFHIWTGKAELLELILNGNPLGSPGSGVMRYLLLTREGLKLDKK